MRTMLIYIICILGLNPVCVLSQDAEKILDDVIKNYAKVTDYQADIHIVTDIPFIRVLPMNAKIYFKQPDKVRLVSKGIAILPRQGFDQMYKTVGDRKNYTVVPQGSDTISGVDASVISILPLSDTMEVILGKFWIDTTRKVILKSQMTTRTNGTIIASYSYGKFAEYGLPEKMTFLVDVKKFKIPKAVAVDLNNYNKKDEQAGKEGRKGKIEISLKNYIINKGIPNKIFSDK